MKSLSALFLICLLLSAASAQVATSANYGITTDTVDSGGKRVTSANYTLDSSLGLIVGISSVTTPMEADKYGYIAQLYEAERLTLTAASLTVNEGGSDQLNASEVLDDTTLLAVPPTNVAWSSPSGPIASINSAGLAIAAIVYQDDVATVQGSYAGLTGMLSVTVTNIDDDNFGTYANDGIDDAWQIHYFGLPPNANAAPNVDFDGTGQSNLFKYTAGLNPLDPNSRFYLKIEKVAGQPGQKNLVFGPRFPDRTYILVSTADLTIGNYAPLTTGSPPRDSGTQRTITDLDASGPMKFYRVKITYP